MGLRAYKDITVNIGLYPFYLVSVDNGYIANSKGKFKLYTESDITYTVVDVIGDIIFT